MKINEGYPPYGTTPDITGVDSWKYIEYRQGLIIRLSPIVKPPPSGINTNRKTIKDKRYEY